MKTKFTWPVTDKFDLKSSTILLGYRGSVAHGMYVPPEDPYSIDDKDVMGIAIPPINFYFGFRKFEQVEKFVDEWDTVIYEFRKFISLLKKNNPNVMSLLWVEPNYHIHMNEFGELLLKNRDLFSSKKAYFSFTGYAHGQLKRMTHYKFEGYMGAKRKALVDKFGYDTKNAAHLIRLLRMGIEFLSSGRMYVLRHDAQELLLIKRGEWELDKVKEEAERLFKLSQEAFMNSKLPEEPDHENIEKLTIEILSKSLFGDFPPNSSYCRSKDFLDWE